MSHTGVFSCGGVIGVQLFLIVNGYGIYCSMEKGANDFWKTRINFVYYPYLFCVVIFLTMRNFIYGEMSFSTVVVNLLGQDFNFNADPAIWYITYVFD